MIEYEKALEKARQQKPNIDNCVEWENGWEFGYSGDEGFMGGYGRTPVVIKKSDGRVMDMISLVIEGAGEYIRAFNI